MNSPTPTKSGRKSTSTVPDDESPLSQLREKFARELRPKGRLPYLDNVIAAVQKLLDANDQILRRCKHSMEYDDQKLSSIIVRRDFRRVKSTYVVGAADGAGYVKFTAAQHYSEKEFDVTPLIKLPPDLALFPPTYKSGLIDFKAIFHMSSMLHDDILVPFLTNLKNQLGLVQSCLNAIDDWLNNPATSMAFLDSVFGKGIVKRAERQKTRQPMCKQCFHHKGWHTHKAGWGHSLWCPNGAGVFKMSNTLLLASYSTPCKTNESFDLSDKNAQAKLRKLVKYVSHE